MGLDVSVYKNIKLAKNEEESDFQAYVSDDNWKRKIKNLQEDAYYVGDMAKVISYAYSSHNRFREQLIKLIGRADLLDNEGHIKWNELPEDLPFINFIDFADNEGCLDWEVSKTIYDDFAKYKEKAENELNQYELGNYLKWLSAFDMSRNNGVVVFS